MSKVMAIGTASKLVQTESTRAVFTRACSMCERGFAARHLVVCDHCARPITAPDRGPASPGNRCTRRHSRRKGRVCRRPPPSETAESPAACGPPSARRAHRKCPRPGLCQECESVVSPSRSALIFALVRPTPKSAVTFLRPTAGSSPGRRRSLATDGVRLCLAASCETWMTVFHPLLPPRIMPMSTPSGTAPLWRPTTLVDARRIWDTEPWSAWTGDLR